MGNFARASALLLLVDCSRDPQQQQQQQQQAGPAAPVASMQPTQMVPPPQKPEAAVKAWNDALNRHDLGALRAAYAPEVMFYGRRLSAAEVVAAKAQAFARDPDFRQDVFDFVATDAPDAVTIRFTKAWTTKGVTRRVGASLGLKRADGRLLVAAEADAATSDAQAKIWSCGRCTSTDKTAPDGFAPHGLKPEYFAWTLEVTKRGGSRLVDLSDAVQAVDFASMAGWSCTVSAAQGHLAMGPTKDSSTYYYEARQLYCAQLDGGTARLMSDVVCSPRGSQTDSDYIELSPENKVQLACAMLPSP